VINWPSSESRSIGVAVAVSAVASTMPADVDTLPSIATLRPRIAGTRQTRRRIGTLRRTRVRRSSARAAGSNNARPRRRAPRVHSKSVNTIEIGARSYFIRRIGISRKFAFPLFGFEDNATSSGGRTGLCTGRLRLHYRNSSHSCVFQGTTRRQCLRQSPRESGPKQRPRVLRGHGNPSEGNSWAA